MHKPKNASLFSVIDLKASHWFEPSQAHCLFEFRFSVAVLPTRFCNPTVCSGRALNALFKTENKQMAPAGRGKQFEREKRQDVCRNLNTRRLQSQAINKLTAFLRDGQK